MIIKTLIFITLAVMLVSLFRGLFFLSKKEPDNKKSLVNSLTVRVVSAAALVALIIIGIKTGDLQPHGLIP